jgi:hypothetical protein
VKTSVSTNAANTREITVFPIKSHNKKQAQAYLIEGNLNVLAFGQSMLLIVQLKGLSKWQGGMKGSHRWNKLLQTGWTITSICNDSTMFFDQDFKMRKGICPCIIETIQNKTVGEHVLHPRKGMSQEIKKNRNSVLCEFTIGHQKRK